MGRTSSCILAAVFFGVPASTPSRADPPVFPGKTWAVKPPGQLGLDADKLDRSRDFMRGRGCVVRHGYLAYTWGDVSRRADMALACKPVFVQSINP